MSESTIRDLGPPTCALLAVVCAAFPSAAHALPTVQVTGRAVAIPGFPHTGNFYGAGAAVQAKVSISGSEYGGFPPPLIGINAYLPVGVHLNPSAFPSCPTVIIMQRHEPRLCPKRLARGRSDGCPASSPSGPKPSKRKRKSFHSLRLTADSSF
jgi:hypothetical protein